jgi:16S rRNA (adenine1518-N6/adenine1519-N6)-dimethyltransferase
MKAKKSLGQHFLKSDSVLERITESVCIKENMTVIEIGPGHGELTKKLLTKGAKVVAIEKDRELIPELKKNFEKEIKEKKLQIIHSDIRNIKTKDIISKKNAPEFKVVGNIPYYITGFILKSFLTDTPKPNQIVFLIQKEVAERIVKSKKESLLSLSIKVYGEPRYIKTVKAGSFSPPPKVDSAIISIEDIKDPFKNKEEELFFFEVLKTGFSQKRKTLLSNLSQKFNKKTLKNIFEKSKINPKERAENVSLERWKVLISSLI